MAKISSTAIFISLLFLVLSLSVLAITSLEPKNDNQDLNIDLIVEALHNRGYEFMSLMFMSFADQFIPEKGVFTMFCVKDEGIKIQPSLHVLHYHVVPAHLNKESLESFKYGKILDTIDPGHHLMVTSTSRSKFGVEINGVGIKDWSIYNDGRIIIHGIHTNFEELAKEKNIEL